MSLYFKLLFLMCLRIRTPRVDPEPTNNDFNLIADHRIHKEDKISFSNCHFNKCNTIGTLFDVSNGGAICAILCDLTVRKCSFNLNRAVFAGCICSYDGEIVILQSNFTNSISIMDVGAVWSMAKQTGYTKPSLWINESSFVNNSAGRYYGAVASNQTNPVIYKCEFIGNNAKEAVGALGIIILSTSFVIDTNFINNTSNGSFNSMKCPALFIQGNFGHVTSKIYMEKCFFNNNFGYDNVHRAFTAFGFTVFYFLDYLCFDGDVSTLYEYVEHPGLINPENIHPSIKTLKECRLFLPTAGFSQSNFFSPSKEFTHSQTFTPEATKVSDYTNPITLYSEYDQDSEEMKSNIQLPESNDFEEQETKGEQNNPSTETAKDENDHLSLENTKEENDHLSLENTNEENDYPSLENTNEENDYPPTAEITKEPNAESSSSSESESTSSEEEKIEEEEPPLNMPALAGGLGILLLIIIIIIIVICCCRKKGGGGCGRLCCCCKKKEIIHEEVNTKNIIMLPQVNEHDGEYADYINPFHIIHDDGY